MMMPPPLCQNKKMHHGPLQSAPEIKRKNKRTSERERNNAWAREESKKTNQTRAKILQGSGTNTLDGGSTGGGPKNNI